MPVLPYSKRRNCQFKETYLLLKEHFVHYKTVGAYESLDEDTEVWTEKKANWRFCRRKSMLIDVSMYFDNKESVWSISMEFSGIAQGPEWMFDSPTDALKIYTQLMDYMIS